MDVIKGEPTAGLTYDPNDPRYWDRAGLAGELERVFEICHGCRLCFNLCPSFPALFDAVDRDDGGVRALTSGDANRVVDLCYQCKICYVKCPYTPDDGHAFQLDFPRLMLRANAVRRRRTGIDLRGRALSRPEMIGRVGGAAAEFTNWANRQPVVRRALEQVAGIHRDKILPEFHAEPFVSEFARGPQPKGDPSKAVLFATCFVNHNNPQVARDAVRVFERSGVALSCPKQNCCGMPALEAGDVELAKANARANVASLTPHAEAGRKIVAINPTCSYMMRKEYPELLGSAAARTVAAATMDLCEFLWSRKQEGAFNRDFKSTPRSVAYHLPCHLKAQNIGYRSRDMMRLIPTTKITLVDQCSGHDGTFAMKKEFFPLSMLAGRKAFDELREAGGAVRATDCPLAAIQFEQALGGERPIHPVQVLERAYRADGFPTPIET